MIKATVVRVIMAKIWHLDWRVDRQRRKEEEMGGQTGYIHERDRQQVFEWDFPKHSTAWT